jgi:C-terminal processing protease CtpA/Prc
MIGVPGGRPINPISKKDWEGTGVEPDVKVPADQALDVAKKMAAEQIERKATNELKTAAMSQ